MRKAIKVAVHEARYVLNMNRDVFAPEVIASFETKISNLKDLRRAGASEAVSDSVADKIKALEAYTKQERPVSISHSVQELVETLVVAFGVAMAFRTYFFQPFKIPTGSMQPTLYGIHSETLTEPSQKYFDNIPPLKIIKWLVTGSRYKEVIANGNGSVAIRSDGQKAPGFVFLTVAGEDFKIPEDAARRGDIKIPVHSNYGMADNPFENQREHGKAYVQQGDCLWRGYVNSGDQLFVNRVWWNFFPPQRDDVIVFTTSEPQFALKKDEAIAWNKSKPHAKVFKVPFLPITVVDTPILGLVPEQHYIKRLVGMPGETISIVHPHVYADGKKIEGYAGMDKVASKQDGHSGYFTIDDVRGDAAHRGFLQNAESSIKLGDEYLPMGDNTRNSYDGRYWGPVPRRHMVGPAACVYWPITRRWGLIN